MILIILIFCKSLIQNLLQWSWQLILCIYKIIILYLLEKEKIWLTVCYNDLDIWYFVNIKVTSSVSYNDLDNLDIFKNLIHNLLQWSWQKILCKYKVTSFFLK